MREAMAHAEVGDDVYGEDPTINRLQEYTAELLGTEAALFVPSGTMANQVAIRAHTQPGDEVVMDARGHSFNFETGATAALCGVQVHPLRTERGIFDGEALEAAIRPSDDHFPHTGLVIVENTHNFGGGSVWSLAQLAEVTKRARKHGVPVHLDGARLFNASVAAGVQAREYCSLVDSASICLSKGLGAPVGSLVAGRRDFIVRCHRFRKQFGGGMRQAGILAAAGLYALEHHVDDLGRDHDHAKRLAKGIAALDGVELDLDAVETNIVFVNLTGPLDASALAARLRDRGTAVSPTGPRTIRFVTHRDVGEADMDTVIEAMAAALTDG